MKLPNINTIKTSSSAITEFKGLNVLNSGAENEFIKAYNVVSDAYPQAEARNLLRHASCSKDVLGMLGGDKLYIFFADKITVLSSSGKKDITATFTNTKKTLVRMGAYIAIFPDKKVFNTADETFQSMEASFTTTSATFSLTDAYGTAITYHDDEYYSSHDAKSGDYMLVNEDGEDVLKQYLETEGMWLNVTTSYIQVSANGIGSAFKKGVGVKFTVDCTDWDEGKSLFPIEDGTKNTATYVLKDVSANAVTFAGILKNSKTVSSFTLKRECPDIAFATECTNRIWGCNKEGTEIYACALGDATSWNTYEGISTDSYTATIGSEGEFTGAITYLGYPTFFKPDSLLKISVSASGAHVLKEVFCRGVAKGCEKSLCIVDEVLHYKTADSIVYYDGSLPTKLSEKLGDMTRIKNVVSGAYKGKLYVCHSNGCYVYDTNLGIWTESDDSFDSFSVYDDIMFYAKNKVLTMSDAVTGITSASEVNSDLHWSIATRDIDYYTPNSKYIQRIVAKMSMVSGSSVKISIKYDDGEWETLIRHMQKGTSIIPISLTMRRCNHFALKIDGIGYCKLYSITKTLAEGSDKY